MPKECQEALERIVGLCEDDPNPVAKISAVAKAALLRENPND